jgi:hypothetical protein
LQPTADAEELTGALVANIITRTIDRLGVTFPAVSAQQLKRLAAAKRELSARK